MEDAMARKHRPARGHSPRAVIVDELDTVPQCGLATCDADAANIIEFKIQERWPTSPPQVGTVRVWRCRRHTHRLHHIVFGPGPA
jgi:hypothetical protein